MDSAGNSKCCYYYYYCYCYYKNDIVQKRTHEGEVGVCTSGTWGEGELR